MLLAQGGAAGGFAFYIKDGRLRYGLNYIARDFFGASSSEVVPEDRHILRFEFEPTGSPDFSVGKGSPGRFQLYVDGDLVGAAEVPHTTPAICALEGLSCGYDALTSVLPDVYDPPFAFTGTIDSVTIDVSGELIEDDEATLKQIMAHQ